MEEHERNSKDKISRTSTSIKGEIIASELVIFVILFMEIVLKIQKCGPFGFNFLPNKFTSFYPLSQYNGKLKFIEFQHVH